MTNYINYGQMSSIERHVFQSIGECDKQFHMGEEEFNQMVDEMIAKQVQQLISQGYEDDSDNLS